MLSGGQLSSDNVEPSTPPIRSSGQSVATQTAPFAPELPQAPAPVAPTPAPKPEIITYSKAVQTDEWIDPRKSVDGESDSDNGRTSRSSKRLSRRERERDEEIRERLRKEIEDEIQATREAAASGNAQKEADTRFPLRTLTNNELDAVTSSNDFLDFVERSSKVIERALDEEYDVLTDYAGGIIGVGEADNDDFDKTKKRRGIEQVAQFWDDRWSKKRMISDINFSPKVRSIGRIPFLFFKKKSSEHITDHVCLNSFRS